VTQAQTARPRMPLDNMLFGATLALVAIGLLMVCDASFPQSLDSAKMGHDAFFFGKRQVVGVIVGLAAMFTMMRFGYWKLRDHALGMMAVGMALLALVWFPHIGVRENNAARWVHLGLTFQPSEIAKLTLIIYIAALLSRPDCKIRHLTEGLGAPLIITGLYLILIEREPDLGTAVVLFLAVMTQLYQGGARKRHIVLVCLASLLGMLVIGFLFKHRTDRIWIYLHPEQDTEGIGYQIHHARLAVGSGGLFGMGWGQGREKYFLPQANSDFIFATMGEELGLLGVLPILTLFALIAWRGCVIARRTKDRFGQLLAVGITSLISWQALINISVVIGLIPATGVPLPFISLGSTSLVFLLVGIGLLLNIAQHPTPPVQPMRERR